MHRWFHRTFNLGDEEGFAWNKGGRLYSDGKGSYQNIPRPERLKMTIDGESVCEIDIRASYLTILHALHRVPFYVSTEVDPYQISGIPGTSSRLGVPCALARRAHGRGGPLNTVE